MKLDLLEMLLIEWYIYQGEIEEGPSSIIIDEPKTERMQKFLSTWD